MFSKNHLRKVGIVNDNDFIKMFINRYKYKKQHESIIKEILAILNSDEFQCDPHAYSANFDSKKNTRQNDLHDLLEFIVTSNILNTDGISNLPETKCKCGHDLLDQCILQIIKNDDNVILKFDQETINNAYKRIMEWRKLKTYMYEV